MGLGGGGGGGYKSYKNAEKIHIQQSIGQKILNFNTSLHRKESIHVLSNRQVDNYKIHVQLANKN